MPVHWLMLAPAIAIIGGFIIYPAAQRAVAVAHVKTNLLNISAQTFVGFDNFAGFSSVPHFHESLRQFDLSGRSATSRSSSCSA